MSEVILKVDNVSKLYRLGTMGTGTFAGDVHRFWKTKVLGQEDPFLKIGQTNDRTSKDKAEFVWALQNINFEVNRGEVLGIIGKNGAGKSTLLKLLSRITTPTTGSIKIAGRMASLLEVGTGFHPELTGRENIFLNGAILGMTKKEIQNRFDEIVDFSGCELYIDTPTKRYSSGMTVRLGFAVAAFLNPEILVVDEVLAVGDAEFQKKAIGKMKDVSKGEGRTVLFVSHNMAAVSMLCDRGIIIRNGKIDGDGEIKSIVDKYLRNDSYAKGKYENPAINTDSLLIKSIALIDPSTNEEKMRYFQDEEIVIKFQILGDLEIWNNYSLFCTLVSMQGVRIFSAESKILNTNELMLYIPSNTLVRGDYQIEAFIHIPKVIAIDKVENVCEFTVVDRGSSLSVHGGYDYGLVFVNSSWQYIN